MLGRVQLVDVVLRIDLIRVLAALDRGNGRGQFGLKGQFRLFLGLYNPEAAFRFIAKLVVLVLADLARVPLAEQFLRHVRVELVQRIVGQPAIPYTDFVYIRLRVDGIRVLGLLPGPPLMNQTFDELATAQSRGLVAAEAQMPLELSLG